MNIFVCRETKTFKIGDFNTQTLKYKITEYLEQSYGIQSEDNPTLVPIFLIQAIENRYSDSRSDYS